MKGLQLIFCLETNSKTLSDWIYIKEILDFYYKNNDGTVKYSKVFLNGKGNYDSRHTNITKNKLIKEFNASEADNISKVIYVIDTDDYDLKNDEKKFLERIKKYCKDNNYDLVLFCKDIERVMIGMKINKNQKDVYAAQFKRKALINKVKKESLSSTSIKQNSSNVLCVLDSIFDNFKKSQI